MATTSPAGIYYRTNSEANSTYEAQQLALATSVNKAVGLIPITPTSVAVSSGSATVSGNGRVTVTANAGSVSLNGVFSANYTGYRIHVLAGSTNNDVYLYARLRNAGTDVVGNNYYNGGFLGYSNATSSTWSASSVGQWYLGSTAALSNGQTPFDLEIHNPYATTYTKGTSLGLTASSGSGVGGLVVGLAQFDTSSFDGITFFMASGSVAAGCYIQIYGYN